MTTPEGKIKDKIKHVLSKHHCYYFMPVQTGFGAAGLDFHCMVVTPVTRFYSVPQAFFIEAKEFSKEPTQRQQNLIDRLTEEYGAKVFVIDSELSLWGLNKWLEQVSKK